MVRIDTTHILPMPKHSHLYNALNTWLGQVPWTHLTHLKTCLAMVSALIHTGEVNLTRWIPYIPCRGLFAQSKQRRLSRWLHNARIQVFQLYSPLIRAALAEWQEECLYLSLDTSLFWDEYCLIRLAVVHRGRTLPLVWHVLKHESAAVSFDAYHQILEQSLESLPSGVKVVLLADRGFVHTQLMEKVVKQLGWHYRIRLKKDCWIWRPGKGVCQLQDFHFNPGEALCLNNVRLHKEEQYGPVHVILGRNNVNGEFWAIVSDEKTTLQTFWEYGLRFDIEENFLDDQSNGWNMQTSQIRCPDALSRLWFILAVATLYVTAQGVQVVETGKRRWVDTHWFRGNSYFRIGWEWVKSSMLNRWQLIHSIKFKSNDDPDPAMASQRQYEKRLYRLEFQVQTLDYSSI